jgi:hypothetical protein
LDRRNAPQWWMALVETSRNFGERRQEMKYVIGVLIAVVTIATALLIRSKLMS